MNQGVFLWVVVPCALAVVCAGGEGWLAARPWAEGGRFLLPGGAGGTLLITAVGYQSATGWDTIGWGYLMLLAGAALAGSLLGLGAGTLLRRRGEGH